MSKVIANPPLPFAHKLFLVFLFGMVMVIGGLIVVKKTPLQAQIHATDQVVIVQVADQDLTIEHATPLPARGQAKEVTQY